MNKQNPPEPLREILEHSLKRLELSKRLREYGIWPIWNETVGTTIARNAQPERIRNGTLFVKVSSPVWMQQLQFMKEMIAEKLNQRLRAEEVKNIFFIVGRIETDIVESEPKTIEPAAPAEPNPDEQFLQTIRDQELRDAFKRLLAGYARRKHK
jgi:hypothetical protein